MLRAELTIATAREGEKLNGSGLIIVNPPGARRRTGCAFAGARRHSGVEKGVTRLDWLVPELKFADVEQQTHLPTSGSKGHWNHKVASVLRFRSSQPRVPQVQVNFGIGTLAGEK